MIDSVDTTETIAVNELDASRTRLFWLSCFRAVEVASVIVFHSVSYGLHCAARIVLRRPAAARTEGQFLVSLLEALGPTFIKFGQVLSSRPDLLPERIVQPLAKLQDRVTPFDARCIPDILASEFGCEMDEIFESFDNAPLAAGSIAQVHCATLQDGRRVAVKIRRPNIEWQLECDLHILRTIGKIVGLIPMFRTVPLADMVRDVGEPIRNQLDFVKEAEHNRRFRRNFAGVEHVRFPQLVNELCTRSVLTMEYVEGLIKLDAASMLDEDSKRVAALAGLRALYKMIFVHGLIHADLHPGNVFIREWGEVVILDTGLVAVLNPSERQNFAEFFFGIVNNEGLRCARIIYEDSSYRAKHFDRDRFDSDIVTLIGRYSARKSSDFEVTQFVYELINIQRRHGLCGSTKFMATILAMVVYDGICKRLHPTCDFQQEARGYLITARYRAVNAAGQFGCSEPFSSEEAACPSIDRTTIERGEVRRAKVINESCAASSHIGESASGS